MKNWYKKKNLTSFGSRCLSWGILGLNAAKNEIKLFVSIYFFNSIIMLYFYQKVFSLHILIISHDIDIHLISNLTISYFFV